MWYDVELSYEVKTFVITKAKLLIRKLIIPLHVSILKNK